MRFGSVFVFTSVTTLSCLLAPACSSDPDLGGDDDQGEGRADATTDASRRDGSTGPDAAPDARRDATTDAGDEEDDAASEEDAGGDAGPPDSGTPCSPVGTRYDRACGVCGLQTAICTANLVVGGYGACLERHPSFCEEPPDAGSADAGETDAGETDAGETDAGETDAGEPPVDTWEGYNIDIDFAVGQSSAIAMPTANGRMGRFSAIERRSCPVPLPGAPSVTDYALVRVRNTTAQSVTLDVNVTRGSGRTDVLLAMYAAPPTTSDELKSCFGSADANTCPDPDGLAAHRLSCLQGTAPVVIPARTAAYAYIGMYATTLNAWNAPGLRVTRR